MMKHRNWFLKNLTQQYKKANFYTTSHIGFIHKYFEENYLRFRIHSNRFLY